MLENESNLNEWKYNTSSSKSRLGKARFDGMPCPTKKVKKAIGIDEVDRIDAVLKKFIEWKKIMFGADSELLGFNAIQSFCKEDVQNVVFCIQGMYIPSRSKKIENLYAFPDRVTPENYTVIFADELLRVISLEMESDIK